MMAQLTRTVQDLGRLVPFSVFVIVPFAELLLPVALKLFPNMLPSTYEGQESKDAKAKRLRSTRKEVSNLLQNTLKETGLPVSSATAHKEEFTEFFRKVCTLQYFIHVVYLKQLLLGPGNGRIADARGCDQGVQDLQR